MSNQDNNEGIKIYVVDSDGKSLAHKGYGPLIAWSEDEVEDTIREFLLYNTTFLEDDSCCLTEFGDSDWEIDPQESETPNTGIFKYVASYNQPTAHTAYFTLEMPADFTD